MTRKALVLGGGGFIGSHLARGLLSAGWAVTCVVRDPSAEAVRRRLGDDALRMRVVAGDASDQSLLDGEVEGVDAVFPCTGRSGAARSLLEPLADLQAGSMSLLILLETLRHRNPSARVVVPGSRLQYGRPESLPVSEGHPQQPTSPYGADRLLSEHYARIYHTIHGLPITCLRISNPYGPHQSRPDRAFGLVGTFFATAMAGETISLFGGGTQVRDYIFIDDLVRLFLVAGTSAEAAGRVYNAGGPRPVSVAEMAAAVVATVGRGNVATSPWPVAESAIETGDYYADLSRARDELGWAPRVDLAEGIAATWSVIQAELGGSG